MGYKVTSAPAAEPLTASEMKAYLKVDTDTDDTLITSLIKGARQYVEAYMGVALITQTIEEKWDAIPPSINGAPASLLLTVYPVQSVTSVAYVDSDGDAQTWASSNYIVDTHRDAARILAAYGVSWPSLRAQANALTVTYVAGYGDAATAVPAHILQAMRLIIADMYDNRTDSVRQLPTAAERLLDRSTHGMFIGL